jgi:mono/diheme cytochrome c family protein
MCAAVGVGPRRTAASTRTRRRRRGKNVYDAHCTECHGPRGKGDGPAAAYLTPHPRDFSTGNYKIRSTETGNVPTDDDLVRSVRQGLYGTAMPAWDRILSDAEISDVVAYLKGMSPQFATPPKVVVSADAAPSSPESITRGRQVYNKLQCSKCHGTDGRGRAPSPPCSETSGSSRCGLRTSPRPWTFHGGATSRDDGTCIPHRDDGNADALVRRSRERAGDVGSGGSYVVSLGRKPVWSMTAQRSCGLYYGGMPKLPRIQCSMESIWSTRWVACCAIRDRRAAARASGHASWPAAC